MTELPHYEAAPWQVRIRRSENAPPVGGGMYGPGGHVITCAHVVDRDCERPDGPVWVEFQNAEPRKPIPAWVADNGWFPPSGDQGRRGDVAVLRLDGPVPAAATAAPLRSSPRGVLSEHRFFAYGYPDDFPSGGTSARGVIVGQADDEWLELRAIGRQLDYGFSGSPVFDPELGGVVGIVVIRNQLPPAARDAATPGMAYAIRMEVLGEYWPALQPKVVRGQPSHDRTLAELLEVGPDAGGTLPTVGATSVYDMGVTKSKYVSAENPKPPYVPRHRLDAEIRKLLDAGERFIVAVGDSKSGKSRSMAENLHERRGEASLIVPNASDPTALSQLAGRPLPLSGQGGVLWLDDIDRYLVPSGLDRRVLRSFLDREPQVTVIGTITSRRYNALTAAHGTGGPGTSREAQAQFSRVLAQARVVHVAGQASAEDRARARELYPAEDFTARGIGEQMVAAPQVEDRYATAREACPEGWAVIQAAVDWRRIGVTGAVSQATLRSLFPRYLAAAAPQLDPGEELFTAGLTWALQPLAGTIALLARAEPGQDRYRAFDYVLACAEGQGRLEPVPVAGPAWDGAIASLGPDELLVVAQAAIIHEEPGIAMRAAETVRAAAQDPAATARAAVLLGELHIAAGEADAAAGLLEEAAASGVTDVVPAAQAALGSILALPGGDPERARALLESAMAAGDPQVTAQAQLALGGLLMGGGDAAAARPLLEAAMAAHEELVDTPFVGLSLQGAAERARLPAKETRLAGPQPDGADTAPVTDDRTRVLRAVSARRAESVHLLAQASLGGLLVNEGDLSQARVLLDAAIASRNPGVEPLARTNLGALLLRHSDLRGAREQFEQVLAGAVDAESVIGQFARVSLGCVLILSGDTQRGYAMLEEVATGDDADQAPRAMCLLAEFRAENGQPEAARSYLDRAIARDHPDWTPYAQVGLATLRARDGDIDGARELIEAMMADPHPAEGARAADVLGDLLASTGDLDGAEAAYRQAIALGHPWWSAVAATDLARLLAQRDAVEEAGGLLRSVIADGEPAAVPMAQDMLGDMLRFRAGDPDAARAAYQQAIDSGHPEWSLVARFDLALLLDAQGDLSGAHEQLLQAAQGPNRGYAAKAWDLIGDLLSRSGDSAGAREAYRKAIAIDAPEWSAVARVDLANLILTETENVAEAEPLLLATTAGPNREAAASARLLLGLIALHRDDPDRAREEFQLAAESGQPQMVAAAMIQIAKIMLEDGELADAAGILEPMVDGSLDNESLELFAAAHLGVVRLRQGDVTAALPLLERAASSGDPDTFGYACLNLGLTLFDLDQVGRAAGLLERAMDSGQPGSGKRRAGRAGRGASGPGPAR